MMTKRMIISANYHYRLVLLLLHHYIKKALLKSMAANNGAAQRNVADSPASQQMESQTMQPPVDQLMSNGCVREIFTEVINLTYSNVYGRNECYPRKGLKECVDSDFENSCLCWFQKISKQIFLCFHLLVGYKKSMVKVK